MSKFKVGDVVRRVTGIDLNIKCISGDPVKIVNEDGRWLGFSFEDGGFGWDSSYFELVSEEEIQNNSKQNPNNIPNFQLRWAIYETSEELYNSWNSEGKVTVVKQCKPVLQYSVDGVEWNNVPEVVIKTN